MRVSIHAPGRGATSTIVSPADAIRSFNSRTREGCDRGARATSVRCLVFQFTHPGGVRPHRTQACRGSHDVSIHAPGRGATHPPHRRLRPYPCFNSRTREGCDRPLASALEQLICFNSRTREGCDLEFLLLSGFPTLVSIHAPGRGATLGRKPRRRRSKVSIHAPGRGATTELFSRFGDAYSFNSRTREGCDNPVGVAELERRLVSIHAPGRGATRHGHQRRGKDAVSIHAPGRGATIESGPSAG